MSALGIGSNTVYELVMHIALGDKSGVDDCYRKGIFESSFEGIPSVFFAIANGQEAMLRYVISLGMKTDAVSEEPTKWYQLYNGSIGVWLPYLGFDWPLLAIGFTYVGDPLDIGAGLSLLDIARAYGQEASVAEMISSYKKTSSSSSRLPSSAKLPLASPRGAASPPPPPAAAFSVPRDTGLTRGASDSIFDAPPPRESVYDYDARSSIYDAPPPAASPTKASLSSDSTKFSYSSPTTSSLSSAAASSGASFADKFLQKQAKSADSGLEAEISALRAENKSVNDMLKSAKAETARLQTENKESREAYENKVRKVNDLQDMVKSMQASLAAVQKEKDELEDERVKSQEQVQRLQKVVKFLEKENEELKAENQRLMDAETVSRASEVAFAKIKDDFKGAPGGSFLSEAESMVAQGFPDIAVAGIYERLDWQFQNFSLKLSRVLSIPKLLRVSEVDAGEVVGKSVRKTIKRAFFKGRTVAKVEWAPGTIPEITAESLRSQLKYAILSNYPNIITWYAALTDGSLIEEMAICSLEDLTTNTKLEAIKLRKDIVGDENILINVARDIVHGLMVLHGQGLAHGNLKSGNVLISEGNIGKIGGVSPVRPKLKVNADEISTVLYAPPERVYGKDKGPVDAMKGDIYSFGAICIELLTMNRVWGERKGLELFKRKLELAQFKEDELPPEIAGVKNRFVQNMLRACLSTDASKRPPLEEIDRVLAKALHTESIKTDSGFVSLQKLTDYLVSPALATAAASSV